MKAKKEWNETPFTLALCLGAPLTVAAYFVAPKVGVNPWIGVASAFAAITAVLTHLYPKRA